MKMRSRDTEMIVLNRHIISCKWNHLATVLYVKIIQCRLLYLLFLSVPHPSFPFHLLTSLGTEAV